jgi:hypothetical protein
LVDFNSTRITVQLYSITNRQILFAWIHLRNCPKYWILFIFYKQFWTWGLNLPGLTKSHYLKFLNFFEEQILSEYFSLISQWWIKSLGQAPACNFFPWATYKMSLKRSNLPLF